MLLRRLLFGTNKDIIHLSEDIKCIIMTKAMQEFFNFDHKLLRNWPQIPDHPYRNLMVGSCRSRWANTLVDPAVAELFIGWRKVYISLIFTRWTYFAVSKNIRSDSTRYFIMRFPNQQKVQQIAINYSSDVHFNDYESLQKMYCKTTLIFSW